MLEFPIEIFYPDKEQEGDCFVTIEDARQVTEVNSLFGLTECQLAEFPNQPLSPNWSKQYRILRISKTLPVDDIKDFPDTDGPSVW